MRLEKQVVFWAVALAILVVVVATLRDVLLPFAAGATIAYGLNPLADRLERLGLGRLVAASLIVALGGLIVVLAVFVLLPLAADQARQLWLTVPADIERLKPGLEAWAQQKFGPRYPEIRSGLDRAFDELSRSWSGMFGLTAQALWNRGLAVVNLVSLLLVTPIVVFYLLRDWPLILARIDSWLPREHAPTVRRLAADIDKAVGAFVRGQGTICLILGALYAVALSVAGLRYGFVIGALTGLFAFVPFVGWSVGLATALVIAVTQGWPDLGLAYSVAGIYAAGMVLDSALLSPGIVGQSIGLHPVWLIFALLVFSALFGFLGVLVAVPVAAALGVLIRFGRDRYLVSSIYLGGNAQHDAAPSRIPGTEH